MERKQALVGTKDQEVFIEKVISINRVTKVTKGGKNLNFAALVVVGNGNGKVGFALGKAPEVAEAIRKAITSAKKRLVAVQLENTTIPHEVIGAFGSIRVLLKPASLGTGVIACLAIRSICDVAGIKNILTKILTKSSNPVNVVKATFQGLQSIKP
ncbi:MAG: 30S ribosomal protein S5 [Candidatus Omnitrophica bacterium]|nr:30S ribosomal protein S5 [Candidatus Omnitrophota bacterium]